MHSSLLPPKHCPLVRCCAQSSPVRSGRTLIPSSQCQLCVCEFREWLCSVCTWPCKLTPIQFAENEGRNCWRGSPTFDCLHYAEIIISPSPPLARVLTTSVLRRHEWVCLIVNMDQQQRQQRSQPIARGTREMQKSNNSYLFNDQSVQTFNWDHVKCNRHRRMDFVPKSVNRGVEKCFGK